MDILKWQKEFSLYRYLKSTFVIEGEIYDKQPFFEDDDYYLLTIEDYLDNYLKNAGYASIVFFDHVDGFSSKRKEDLKEFEKQIKKVRKIEQDTEFGLLSDKNDRSSKFRDGTDKVRDVMKNTESPVAIVLKMASRYINSSDHLSNDEIFFYSELFLASQTLRNPISALDENLRLNNLIILLTDKINDIPTWFYLNNPNVKSLLITSPNRDMREKFLDIYVDEIKGANEFKKKNPQEFESIKTKFIDITEGLRNVDLESLIKLMRNENISYSNFEEALTLYKYGVKENPWTDSRLIENLEKLESVLKQDIKGQDECIRHVSDIITRAVYNLSGLTHSSSHAKPKGIMFFTGPTGTGKTQLAKSLAKWLFNNEESVIRFDMSEYSQSHSDQKLLGAPPGYVGYESGGQLTNAVKEKPFSILLFDEIEKADPTILDKFLQILEDGRMTDGKGETIYFSDTVIIFTSNLGVSKRLPNGKYQVTVDYDHGLDYMAYHEKVMEGVSDYFINQANRPELKNRFGDNFIVFNYIEKETGKLILNSQLNKIISRLKSVNNIDLELSDEATQYLEEVSEKYLRQGGRGVGNALEKYFVNPLGRFLAERKIQKNHRLRLINIELVNSSPVFDMELL